MTTSNIYTLITRITLMLILLYIVPWAANGQYFVDRSKVMSSEQLNQTISAEISEVSLTEAVYMLIQEVDGLTLNYNPDIIPEGETINASFQNVTLEKALSQILAERKLTYLATKKGQIVLVPNNQEQQELDTVTGTVTDSETNEPLPGVNVSVEGTYLGTSTNIDGEFQIEIPSLEETLIFTYVGYERKHVELEGRPELDISLVSAVIAGEEVVIVGYGEQRIENLTGSVSQIGGERLEIQGAILPSAALMGSSAGVTVSQQSGQPGRNHGNIQIRGIGTLSNSDALVLIDGVQGNIDDVATSDIQDISVLKDAASAAIYGSRAANGVILIQTKRGQQETILFDYKSHYGINQPTRQPEYVDAGTFMRLENEGSTNLGGPQIWSDDFIQEWKENHKTDPDNYPNTDWVDEVFSGSGFQQTQQLAVSGRQGSVRYRGSLNYDQEIGTIPSFGFNRYSVRLNTDIDVTDRIDFQADLNTVRTDRERSAHSIFLITEQAYRIPPIYAAQFSDGGWGPGWDGRNPLAYVHDGGQRTDEDYVVRGRFSANYNAPVQGLEFDISYSPYYQSGFFKRMRKNYQVHDPNTGELMHTEPEQNDLLQGFHRNFTHNLNFITNFQTVLQDVHNFEVLGGYELIDYQRDVFNAYREDFILQDFEQLNAGSTANQQNSGRATAYNLQSFFGRINYNYDSRYLFEANLRYDGSSRFAEGNRWGVFPSFSAGWNISDEAFMQNIEPISELKIRGSWGILGDQELNGNFPYIATVHLDREFIFGGEPQLGAAQLSLANENLTWEETTTLNFGTDLGFFNQRLSLSFDWFKRRTEDILLQLPIPQIIGMSAPFQNAGVVENTGWELEAAYRDHVGREAFFEISFNLSDVNNEVVDLRNAGPFISAYSIIKEGEPINSYYGYVADGLFQTQQEINEHANQPGNIAPGDIKYRDLNEDGVITPDDRTVIGDPFPRYTFGINLDASYRNFDLSALFQGVGKRDVLLRGRPVWPLWHAGKVTKEQAEDYWTPENPDATYPRLTQATTHNNFQGSSYWIYDASYLRLRNLVVGYSLPPDLTNRLNIRNARIYVLGQNLFTLFDDLPQGVDPNVPDHTTGDFYPVNRLISAGIEIGI